MFTLHAASAVGVGDALHQMPPAWTARHNSLAPSQGGIAVTREQMQQIAKYDTNMNCWRHILPILGGIEDSCLPVNLTSGEVFPWWVWMANTGQLETASGNGVLEIHLVKLDQTRHLIVARQDGYTKISGKGKQAPICRDQFLLLRSKRVVKKDGA